MPRLNRAEVAEVFERVGLQPFREFGDLDVGDAAVGLADVEQLACGPANGKGVVGEELGAPAVAELRAGDDDVEGSELAFQLDPVQATAAGLVQRIRRP